MANRKEIIDIIERTPPSQPIMLSGIHGIGKSESLRGHFEAKGYRVIILFVGQMADAGDLIGLPERVDTTITLEDGSTITRKITQFCPPAWWPLDKDEKVIIFFDEVNRGKPEIMQCLMDMVLNRKLNGLELPSETRIVGAINPIDDGYYQVEDLDPAFLNRWNRYDFKPTLAEWTEWATGAGIEKSVITFLNKNPSLLDPPSSKEISANDEIFPSRRSWHKASDFIKMNSDCDDYTMKNYMIGCIGPMATSKFAPYLKDYKNNIDPVSVLTKWDRGIKKLIESYNIQDTIAFNTELVYWFEENQDDWKESTQLGLTVTGNLKRYFDSITEEAEAQFMNQLAEKTSEGVKWPSDLMMIDNTIADRMLKVRNGDIDIDDY